MHVCMHVSTRVYDAYRTHACVDVDVVVVNLYLHYVLIAHIVTDSHRAREKVSL